MLENIQQAITGLLAAMGSILSPTAAAADAFGPTEAGVTAISILFAIPITALAAKKVTSLINSIRG